MLHGAGRSSLVVLATTLQKMTVRYLPFPETERPTRGHAFRLRGTISRRCRGMAAYLLLYVCSEELFRHIWRDHGCSGHERWVLLPSPPLHAAFSALYSLLTCFFLAPNAAHAVSLILSSAVTIAHASHSTLFCRQVDWHGQRFWLRHV